MARPSNAASLRLRSFENPEGVLPQSPGFDQLLLAGVDRTLGTVSSNFKTLKGFYGPFIEPFQGSIPPQSLTLGYVV